MKIDWEKCASVTTRGKPYFYTGLTSEHNQRLWVMWDRITELWKVEGECPDSNTTIILCGGFKTAKEAIIHVNKNI